MRDCVTPCIYGVSLSRPHAYGAGEIPSYRARDPRRACVRACVYPTLCVRRCTGGTRAGDRRAGDGRGAREADPGARARREARARAKDAKDGGRKAEGAKVCCDVIDVW